MIISVLEITGYFLRMSYLKGKSDDIGILPKPFRCRVSLYVRLQIHLPVEPLPLQAGEGLLSSTCYIIGHTSHGNSGGEFVVGRGGLRYT